MGSVTRRLRRHLDRDAVERARAEIARHERVERNKREMTDEDDERPS